jgi:osmoprotectant transport system ATP-binding protein
MITAENLSKHFGRTIAVDDISFEVNEGENLVLLGTSGCGKTTTLKMLNRLIAPSQGRITINNTDITQQSPETLRRGIGYVLQHNSLFPHYTVAENIAVVPKLLGWDKDRIKKRTEDLLEILRLPASYLSIYPHKLSGGQQQRVNIARALAADPPVLLMDEPFGALDTITRSEICRDFMEIEAFMQKTIVMVTHDVQEAFLLGDRIALMCDGKIVQEGKPIDLLFHPATDFVKKFFSGSYLRLALGTIKVQDIWDEMSEDNTGDVPSVTLPANDSLWGIMEYAIKNKDCTTMIIQNKEGKTKQVHREELIKAFYQPMI